MRLIGVFVAATVLVAPTLCNAQSVEDFYRGKTRQHDHRLSAGGANDLYARAVARHIGKHIPGNPRSCRATCRAAAA